MAHADEADEQHLEAYAYLSLLDLAGLRVYGPGGRAIARCHYYVIGIRARSHLSEEMNDVPF